MPQYLERPGAAVGQITDLVNAGLLRVHASTVTVREWRSQMLGKVKQAIRELHKTLRTFLVHNPLQQLALQSEIKQISDRSGDTSAEAERVANGECDKILQQMKLTELPFAAADQDTVFKLYFAGDPPFAEPKKRYDIPDAFIWCAADALARQLSGQTVLALCADERLRKALGKLTGFRTFKNSDELFKSDEVQNLMPHLDLFKAWNSGKKRAAIDYLKTRPDPLTIESNEFVERELLGLQVSDESIPVYGPITVDSIQSEPKVQFYWDDVEDLTPGWLKVPFELTCEVELEIWRVISNPNDPSYERPDMEYVGNVGRELRAEGSVSFRFTLESLNAEGGPVPTDIDFQDYRTEIFALSHNPYDEHDPD